MSDQVRLVMEDCVVDVEKSVAELLKLPPVKLTIDGREVEVPRTTLVVNPVALIIATPVADDFHLAEFVRSCVLLSA